MSFHIRAARPEDRGQIIELLRLLLPDLDPEVRWSWLYAGNPHGAALTWIAVDDASGRFAGCTSFFPRRLWVEGREVAGALGGDGFVHPDFRRRGIGGAMHKASRADMKARGLEVMFGTPMPANATPLGQAGARDVTMTVRQVRPLRLKGTSLFADLTALVAPGRPTRARLEPMVDGDPRVDAVWRATRDEVRIGTVRDAAFYTWRFLRSPSRRQLPYVVMRGDEPLGVVALEHADRRVRVVDLLAPAADWSRVLRAVAAHSRGQDALEMRLTRQEAARRNLARQAWLSRDEKPLNILLPEGDPNSGIYFDGDRWSFTWADSDTDLAI